MSEARVIDDAQEILTAVSTFVAIFDNWTLNDMGVHLTSTEADAMAEVFRASGYSDRAETLIKASARGDDDEDDDE